jgi:hypothetical protein
MKGNWRGARTRDSVLIVTTAAETLSTTSAYDVFTPALVAAGGAEGGGRLTGSSHRPQLLTTASNKSNSHAFGDESHPPTI